MKALASFPIGRDLRTVTRAIGAVPIKDGDGVAMKRAIGHHAFPMLNPRLFFRLGAGNRTRLELAQRPLGVLDQSRGRQRCGYRLYYFHSTPRLSSAMARLARAGLLPDRPRTDDGWADPRLSPLVGPHTLSASPRAEWAAHVSPIGRNWSWAL